MRRNRLRTRRLRATRQKLSTTVARENMAFLQALARKQASSLADVVDSILAEARQAENRARLSRQTAEYFANLTPEEIREENELGSIMTAAAAEVDFERG